MKNTLLISLILFAARLLSQTNISGTIGGSLNLQGSPYHVTGHIMVVPNTTLTVMPGVTVQMEGHFKINVQGVLSARGTVTDSIFFKMNPSMQSTGWWGIRFELTPSSQDSSIAEYCNISGGNSQGNGDDNRGGAIFSRGFSKLRVSHCLIHHNQADFGAGISLNSSNAIIGYNRINENTGAPGSNEGGGGGIHCDGVASAKISDNDISYNTITTGGGYGSGLFCTSSSPLVSNNQIHHNNGGYAGGGVAYLALSGGVFSNNNVNYNSSLDAGGLLLGSSNPVVISNTISNNSTQAGNSYGGGIWVDDFVWGSVLIRNNLISFNQAFHAGGIAVSGGPAAVIGNTIHGNTGVEGGAIYQEIGYSEYTNNLITNNTATKGGGVYGWNGNTQLTGNIIANNTAVENGGGVFFNGSSPRVVNCHIVNNYANTLPSYTTYVYGGAGIYCTSASNPTITNSILWGNIAQSNNGNMIYLDDNASDPSIINTVLQNGLPGIYTNGSVYSGTFTNNLTSDPSFANPSAGTGTTSNGMTADWRLQQNSPAINSGRPDTTGLFLPVNDLYGNLRARGIIDRGAYESSDCGTFSVSALISQDGIILSSAYPGTHYQWLDCNSSFSAITGATLSSFTPTVNGNYSVRVTQFGCSDNSPCVVVTTVGFIENITNSLNIYPNPSAGQITIEGLPPACSVNLVNTLGQIVGSFETKNESMEITIPSEGLYILRVISGNRKFFHKILVEKK